LSALVADGVRQNVSHYFVDRSGGIDDDMAGAPKCSEIIGMPGNDSRKLVR
jgi:hypothetical protein